MCRQWVSGASRAYARSALCDEAERDTLAAGAGCAILEAVKRRLATMTRRPNALVPIDGGRASERDGNDRHSARVRHGYGEPPEIVQAALGQAGKLAATKLLSTIQSPDFAKLSARDQLRWLRTALDRAYGPALARRDSGMADPERLALADTLERLAAAVPLPEMRDK